jgi:flagellar biosynthetic protein FliS
MNPYQKYRRQEEVVSWTRADLLLALYDKALERLDRAEASLQAGDAVAATSQLAKAQLTVMALASGVNVEVNPENGTNMLRLYEFVVHELRTLNAPGIANARKVLRTLREGFEAIRDEANEMERRGQIPPVDQLQLVLATA